MEDNPGTNNTSFKIQLSSNWFRENDIISEGLIVLEKPKRKWYKLLLNLSFPDGLALVIKKAMLTRILVLS